MVGDILGLWPGLKVTCRRKSQSQLYHTDGNVRRAFVEERGELQPGAEVTRAVGSRMMDGRQVC